MRQNAFEFMSEKFGEDAVRPQLEKVYKGLGELDDKGP